MTRCCPHCGGTGLAPEPVQTADATEALRAACRERGIWLSHDDRVREADAADLLGLAAKTLCNWRSADRRLPFEPRNGRPLYALVDLAAWLAKP